MHLRPTTLLQLWPDTTVWENTWRFSGLSLGTLRETVDATEAAAVLADLMALLGDDHDRVTKRWARLDVLRTAGTGGAS